MALHAPAVRVGITGEVYAAPNGATITPPASATDTLDTDFVGLGYISEDGVTETYEDTIEDIIAWQNATVVRSVTTESTARLTFTMIETKGAVLEVYHKGSTVEPVGAGQWKVDVVPGSTDRRAFVIDVVDGTKHLRIYVPDGEVTERQEITYASGEPIGYGVTITCYPDANNVVLTKFSDDANWGYS